MSGVGDFRITTSIFTFATGSGQGTSRSFNIPIVNDELVEDAEEFSILATITGAATFFGGGNTVNFQIGIIDNDGMY